MVYYCNARTRRCAKCGHKFAKEEHELWNCPECGEDRHCHRTVKAEGLRCFLHGGKSVSGIASPNFKHGRYSKVLPAGLAERYEAALDDQEILAMRDEIALLDTRLTDLVGGLTVGTSRELWKNLRTAYGELRSALAQQDPDAANIAMLTLGSAITNGSKERETWDEVYTLLEQRRKLTESEAKRLIQMQQVITAEQAMILLARVQQAIVENVTDKRALAAIAAEFRELVLAPARG